MCDQQRLRPACAYAESGQSLCWSLEYSMTVKLLTEHNLEFLSLTGGCTGLSESTLVKMPHCWKSHVAAQMIWSELHRLQTPILNICLTTPLTLFMMLPTFTRVDSNLLISSTMEFICIFNTKNHLHRHSDC